jgi:hypothetical protein
MSGYDKDRYWQPPGLSAIQLQLSIALTRRANGDELGCYDALKDLAVLTESKEIIKLAEDFEKETDKTLTNMRSRGLLTQADRYVHQLDEIRYLKVSNYQFLKLIIMESAKRGITLKITHEVEKGGEPSA